MVNMRVYYAMSSRIPFIWSESILYGVKSQREVKAPSGTVDKYSNVFSRKFKEPMDP
jgi:hypothetical protein